MDDVNGLTNLVAITSVIQDLLEMRQRPGILVNEDVPHIQFDGLLSLGIDPGAGFANRLQHAKRRTKNLRAAPSKGVKPTAAEAIDQRDAQPISSSCVKCALLKVSNQVSNQHLMLRHTVRIDLRRSVPPIVVTLCQEQAFLRCWSGSALHRVSRARKLVPMAATQGAASLAFSDSGELDL